MPPDEFDRGNVMLDFRHVTTHRRPRFYPSIGFLIPAQAEMYRFDQSLSKKIGRKAIKLIRKPLFGECLVGSACRARTGFSMSWPNAPLWDDLHLKIA